MSGKRGWCAFLAMFLVANCSLGVITLEQVYFRDATTAFYQNDTDAGGMVFIVVRNGGVAEETILDAKVNGTSLASWQGSGQILWWRARPSLLAPGKCATIVAKGGGAPFQENSIVDVEVTCTSGTSGSASGVQLLTPALRISDVIPAHDRKTVYIYARNLDSGQSYRVDQIRWNGVDIAGNCTFYPDSRWLNPRGILIAKATFSEPQRLLEDLPVELVCQAASGTVVRTGAPIRMSEGWFPLGTWGSDIPVSIAHLEKARELNLDTDLAGNYEQYGSYYLKRADGCGEPPIPAEVQDRAGRANVRAHLVRDEPKLSSDPPAQLASWVDVYRSNDSGTPTWMTLHNAQTFNIYGWLSDIIAEDHYAMFDAPNIIGGTWSPFGRYGRLDEAYYFARMLKENTEPTRMWTWSQLAFPGGWDVQPPAWGINAQFWHNIIAGSKGVLWFQYAANYENAAPDQVNEASRIAKQFNTIREGVLHSVPVDDLTCSSPNVLKANLIGIDQQIAVLVNDNYTISGSTWNPSYTLNAMTVDLSIPVRPWIPVERVVELLPDGDVVTPTYGHVGTTVFLNGLSLFDRARVFLIGRHDSMPPSVPTGVKIARQIGTTGRVISWRESRDNVGVRGYKVFRNGQEFVDVRAPLAVDNASGGSPVYTVKAYDAAGNISEESGPLRITVQPQSIKTCQDVDVSWTVVVAGSDAVSYRWYKNGTPIGTDSDTLTLHVGLVDDDSYITCLISDGLTSVTSQPARLDVYFCAQPDLDRDGDVDSDDLNAFRACMTGPDAGPPAAGCQVADFDGDQDVDQSDFSPLQRCLKGADVTPDASCAD